MATVYLHVDEVQKALWVAAAHDERVSLSEWIRRRCDGGLAAGVGEVVVAPRRQGSSGLESRSVAASGTSAPAASPLDAVAPDENARLGKHSFSPSSRKCGADVARGTRCKLCGEKH